MEDGDGRLTLAVSVGEPARRNEIAHADAVDAPPRRRCNVVFIPCTNTPRVQSSLCRMMQRPYQCRTNESRLSHGNLRWGTYLSIIHT